MTTTATTREKVSADDLVGYLASTGTPVETREKLKGRIAEHGPGMTAAELVTWMQAAGVTYGTVAKAGRWTYADDRWEPASAPPAGPLEEQLADARNRIKVLEADNTALREERQALLDRVNFYRQRVEALPS